LFLPVLFSWPLSSFDQRRCDLPHRTFIVAIELTGRHRRLRTTHPESSGLAPTGALVRADLLCGPLQSVSAQRMPWEPLPAPDPPSEQAWHAAPLAPQEPAAPPALPERMAHCSTSVAGVAPEEPALRPPSEW
jgi:hypothetical protein